MSTVSILRLPLQARQLLLGGLGKREKDSVRRCREDHGQQNRRLVELRGFLCNGDFYYHRRGHTSSSYRYGRWKRHEAQRRTYKTHCRILDWKATGRRVDTGVGNCRCRLSLLFNRRTRATALHTPKKYNTSRWHSRRCKYSPCSCDGTSPFSCDKNKLGLHF
jgi:hypothetical protein